MNSAYKLTYHKGALKFLAKQNKETQERIVEGLKGLLEYPPQGDIKKMSGGELYRLRIGTFRVLFRLDHVGKEIFIEAIGNRGDIYK